MRKVIRWKIVLPIILMILVNTAAYIQVSYVTFRDFEIRDCTDYCKGLTALIAGDVIRAEDIDAFLEQGRSHPDYARAEEKLNNLRAAYPDVIYLYIYQIREDGCHVVFDLDTPEFPGSEPGTVEKFFAAFEPYIPDLLAGKEIPPIVSDEEYGHVLTILTPLTDANGECKCYIGADCSMEALNTYVWDVIRQILVIFGIVAGLILTASLITAQRGVIRHMHKLEDRAYRDTLTGLQNRAACYEYAAELNKKQKKGEADYSVIMLDLNYLKRVNDTYGHDQGNAYLKNAAELIRKAFGDEHTYRIGGDEFTVILEGGAQEGAEERIRAFRAETGRLQADESLQPWEKVSAAAGLAKYNPETDTGFDEVLRNADETMYRDKVAMKAVRTE